MCVAMNYNEGIELMQKKWAAGSGKFYPCSEYPELSITYPGYKNFGDYRVEVGAVAITHFDVCKKLHENIKQGECEYGEIVMLLEDIYKNGTRIDFEKYLSPNARKIATLIFWMTLQDESNFPQQKGFQGRRMPFSRYFEAVYCAEFKCEFDMQTIKDRCFVRGARPRPFAIPEKPSFYCF